MRKDGGGTGGTAAPATVVEQGPHAGHARPRQCRPLNLFVRVQDAGMVARMPRPPTEYSHGAIPQTLSFPFCVHFPFVTRDFQGVELGKSDGVAGPASRTGRPRVSPTLCRGLPHFPGSPAVSRVRCSPASAISPPSGHMVRVPPLSPVPAPWRRQGSGWRESRLG